MELDDQEELELEESIDHANPAALSAAAAAAASAASGNTGIDVDDADVDIPGRDLDDFDEFDELEDESSGRVADGKSSHSNNANARANSAQQRAAQPFAPTRQKSSLQYTSVALPLLLRSSSASALVKPSAMSELLKSCVTAVKELEKEREKDHINSHSSHGSPSLLSDKSDSVSGSSGINMSGLDDDHIRCAPYHIEADNRSTCAECLKRSLIPAYSQASQFLLTHQTLYQFDYSLKQHALTSLAHSRWSPSSNTTTFTASNANTELSVLSQLLLSYLGEPQSSNPSSSSSFSSPSPPPSSIDPRFLHILQTAMQNQSPYLMDLTTSEEQFYTRISALCLSAAQHQSLHQAHQAMSASSEATVPLVQIRETLMKFWLGRGCVQQTFDAIKFLLHTCHSSSPLQLSTFLDEWQQITRSRRRSLLRVSRLRVLSELPHAARKVQFICSTIPTLTPTATPSKRPGRTWNFESDSGWVRLDDRVCQILEEAYQSGKASVDYSIENQNFTYRADLNKMVQRNLHTGRERPLRCLLALLIRESGGRVSQTVEINMPHSTSILELRTELANYLRWDERQLRMTYAGKVLRKADYEKVSIRDAIVPLGSEPLTVTKLVKGDMEELCSFTITGPKAVKQPLVECQQCGFIICNVCAIQCHKGHETRVVDKNSPAAVGFCCCGAGAGGDILPCRSQEEQPEDAETFYGPHMTLSPKGDFMYIIATEYGLLKVGTGEAGSTAGKLYMQNTRMSAHAGAQLACVNGQNGCEVLLMRSPVLGSDVLLHIDVKTLLFTSGRTHLPSQGSTETSPNQFPYPPTSFIGNARTWQLQYCIKPDSNADSESNTEILGEDGQPMPQGWLNLPSSLLVQVKSALCRNFEWGDICWQQPNDSSLMSVVFEEEGMHLRMPSKLGIHRCRIRLKHQEHIMPIFTQKQSLHVLNLVPIVEQSHPHQSESSNPRAPRRYAIELSLYQLPSQSQPALAATYCRHCTGMMQVDPSSPVIDPSVRSVEYCPRCDRNMTAAAATDEEKVSSESKTSVSPTSSNPPSLPASPPSNSVAYSASSAMAASLPAPLPSSSFPSSSASPTPASPSPVSPSALEFPMDSSAIPAGDSFFDHAWMIENSNFPRDALRSFPIDWLKATFVQTTRISAVVDTYKHVAGNMSDSTTTSTASTSTSASSGAYQSSVSSTSSNKRATCDGCGSSGSPVLMSQGALTQYASTSSLSHLSVCLDRSCSDSVVLCKWCSLWGNWQSKTHTHAHAMQRINAADGEANRFENNYPTSVADSATSLHLPHLHLGGFASYIDFRRGVLVLLHSPSLPPTAANVTSSSHRESCMLFDIHSGSALSANVLIKTRGDCYMHDETNDVVWAFGTVGARLERWDCIVEPNEQFEVKQVANGDLIQGIDAATVLLRELPSLCSSTAAFSTVLAHLVDICDFAWNNAFIHSSHPQFVNMLLFQIRAQLHHWNVISNPLLAQPGQTTTEVTDANTNLQQTAAKLTALLEAAIGIQGASIDKLRREQRSPAHRTLFSDNTTPVTITAKWPENLQMLTCAILVEGFELFYPSAKARMQLLSTLMEASVSFPSADQPLAVPVITPIPCARSLLAELSARYRRHYQGLACISPIPLLLPTFDVQDSSLMSSVVQNSLHAWIDFMSESDASQATEATVYQVDKQHVITQYVLHSVVQHIQLLANLQQAASVKSSNMLLVNRQLRVANIAFVKLATEIFQHAVELVQISETRYESTPPSTDAQVQLTEDAARAESILRFLSESSIGELMAWVLLFMADLQIEKLALLSSTNTSHTNLIPTFLQSTIALLCSLSSLQSRALRVSRVEQSTDISADLITPNHTRLRLSDIRRKISSLRSSAQLLTLQSLHVPPSGTNPTAAARGNVKRVKSSQAQQPPYVLTAAAAEVFTEIFYEFATQYQVPSARSASDQHQWSLGRVSMSRADLAHFLRKRGTHNHESAMPRAIQLCTKYGRSASGGVNGSSRLLYGDQSCSMNLSGFLLMMTDNAVENSRRLLRDLRMLELRHNFLQTHHPALQLLPDLKVAFSRVLDKLFNQQSSDGQLRTGSTGVSNSTPASAAVTYAQALLNRSIDELVNIPPGSTEPSESLKAVNQAALNTSNATNVNGESIDIPASMHPAFSQDIILKLLNSQESFNRQSTVAKVKLHFLSQFISVPSAAITASLPLTSPIASLTPMLLHEVFAEDVASSLVGESQTKKREAAVLIANSTADAHTFSDALCTQRLSELFQRCTREASPQGIAAFKIFPDQDPTMTQHHSRSLLSTLALMSAGADGAPSTVDGSVSINTAVFLCEKLFACALIKHNGLTDECIAYARSLELYRLLSNNQTKNVRLMSSPACPEWFKKIVRATVRYVRTPVLDRIKRHKEFLIDEEKRRNEAVAKVGTSKSITDASNVLERKEDDEVPVSAPPTAPPTPATDRHKLNVSVTEPEISSSSSSPPAMSPISSEYPCGPLYLLLERMIANAEFLLGADVKNVLLGVNTSAPSRAASKPVSIKSSPMKDHGSRTIESTETPLSATRTLDLNHSTTITGADGVESDNDTSDEDSPYQSPNASEETGGGLLLRRVQSDLFASPCRSGAPGNPNQMSNLDLGAQSQGPSLKPPGLLPTTATTPTSTRRLSDSDINIQLLASGSNVDRPSTAGTEGLSSWTSTSLNPRSAVGATGDDDSTDASEWQAQVSFESDWLARLFSSEELLSQSIGSSVQWLTSTMRNRVQLLQLLNAAFQAGHTQQLLDDVLDLCRQVVKDIQNSNSMRGANQDATQNALLFFYQHLAQTLSRLEWQESKSISANPTASVADFNRAPDQLLLMHTRSTPLLRTTSISSSLLSSVAPASSFSTPLQRQQLRQTGSRIRIILSLFSMEVSGSDSDLLLGSGLLSVLPRFIFKLHQSQFEHQQFLHQTLFQPSASPALSPYSLSRSNSQDSLSTHSTVSLPAAIPSATSFWLIDEAVKLSSSAQNWSHQILMYHCSSLLGLPPSAKTSQQRYVLASTLGRQLNSMIQDHVNRIQMAMMTGYPFHTQRVKLADSIPAARVTSESLSEFGSFPLQIGNPLQASLREVDELVYRTVDLLNLLQRISSQEHSVCSRKHLLFLLRSLRNPHADGIAHVPLPSIIQSEIIKLLRYELVYHAPMNSPSAPPSNASSTFNSPTASGKPGTPNFRSAFFAQPISPSVAAPAQQYPATSTPLQRTPSLQAEDAQYADVDLAAELLQTVASMQSQQHLFNFSCMQTDTSQRKARESAKESMIEQKFSETLSPTKQRDGTVAALDLSVLSPSPPPSSASAAPNPATYSKEQARQASFRRIGVLLCPDCSYIEFPACGHHKSFLTRELQDGSAACPDVTCTMNTGTSSPWTRCLMCKKGKANLSFWLVSESEATYCASAFKSTHTPVISHNVFLCSGCKVVEFPGTKTSGLTLNVDGKLYDKTTKKFVPTDQYVCVHYTANCTGTVALKPVRLSKEEATYLGRFIKRTPPIDITVPLAEFGPGKGSTFSKKSTSEDASMRHPFEGRSSIAILSTLLGEPYAYQSWLATNQGQQTALMEMVSLIRNFIQMPIVRDRERSGDASSVSASADSGLMGRATSSVETTQSAVPLRLQWREALLVPLKAAFYSTHSSLESIASNISSFSSVDVQRALLSVLALQVLGGLSELIHTGSKVQVKIGETLITGEVRHYDPTLATVSVAVKRHVVTDATQAEKANGRRQSSDADVISLLSSLGLSKEVSSAAQGLYEFPVDSVVPISPSNPPPLSTLGRISDFLQQARAVLTLDTPDQLPNPPDDEKSVDGEPNQSISIRYALHELILFQTQYHLLLVLMHYLPQWLNSNSSSELGVDVVDLLRVCVDKWHSSPVSTQVALHTHEWPNVARLAAQEICELASKMQHDPIFFKRIEIQQNLTSPDSQASANQAAKQRKADQASAIVNTAADATSLATAAPANKPPSAPKTSSTTSLNISQSAHSNSHSSNLSAIKSARRAVGLALTPPSGAPSFLFHNDSEFESEDEPMSAASPLVSSSPSHPMPPPPIPSLLQNLDRLTSMGFPAVACRYALASARGNLDASISIILERLNDEEGEIDEEVANASFENAIDRMGQRDAVEHWRAWQEAEMMRMAARQAETVLGQAAPQAPPLANSSSVSSASSSSVKVASAPKTVTDAERRLIATAPHIHMANRYAYTEEDPLEALALASPLDNAVATSRALNSSAAKPEEYSIIQDRMKLMASAKAGTLIGTELLISMEALDATVGTRVGATVKKVFPYKIGDTLTIIDLVNKVCPAVVDDLNVETNKIFIHYIGWSKRWDEWVAVDSKRIQPKFNVGDRLTVRDSTNKPCEVVVSEVAIKENTLKIFIKYVGWSNRYDEWIPANSNRIVSRHDKKEKSESATTAPFATLQKALGLSSPDSLRLPPSPFDISNRVGVVEKVDMRSGEFSEDDGPLVLVRVVDESLNVTIKMWLRLALLRSVIPLAHQTPCHLSPIPPKATVFNSASLHAMHLSTNELVQFAVDAQQRALAIMSKRIMQDAITLLTSAATERRSSETVEAGSDSPVGVRFLSPISPLSPLLQQAGSLTSLPVLLQQIKLQDLLPLLCHPLCPSSLVSMLSFSHSESLSSTGLQFDNDRSRLVASVAQLLLAKWQAEVLGFDQHYANDTDTLPSIVQHSFEDEFFQIIENSSQSLLHAASKLKLHQLTVISPGQTTQIGIEWTDDNSQTNADSNVDDDEGPDEPTSPFTLQLVSVVLDPFMSELPAPKFARDSVWTIRFWADAAHTVLLKEMNCTADPHSRNIPTFVVTNPVYITASHTAKSLQKLKESRSSSKVLKLAAEEQNVSFSISPLTHSSLEMLVLLTEAVVHIRRLQIAGQTALESDSKASSSSTFSFADSATSNRFLRSVVSSSTLANTLDHFLTILYETLKDFTEVISRLIPVPSNLKTRAVDTLALIISTEIINRKSKRNENGVRKRDINRPKDRAATESEEEDEEESQFLQSMNEEELDVSWMIDLVVNETKARLNAERNNSPLYSVYVQRLMQLLLVGIRYECMATSFEALDMGDDLSDLLAKSQIADGHLRMTIQRELPVVLAMERLLIHATSSLAHPPLDDSGVDAKECKCEWCQEFYENKEEAQQAAAFIDFSASSIVATLLHDLDQFPDIFDVETGLKRKRTAQLSSSLTVESTELDEMAQAMQLNPNVTLSSMFNAFHTAANLFRSVSDERKKESNRSQVSDRNARDVQDSPSDLWSSAASSSPTNASGSRNEVAPFSHSNDWRAQVSVCDRLLPSGVLRTRLLNLLLNGTAAANLPRPEIAFRRGADVEEMTSVTQSKHRYRSVSHTHPTAAALLKKKKSSALEGDDAFGRGNMFQQLVDAFIKSNLYHRPISLRAELGAVTFKCILSGVLDQGAAGLPGPFRQALAEISSYLNADALDSSSTDSLFIVTPNSRSQTGDDRNKLLLNPALVQNGEISLVQCRIFGQLIGIAIRSKCCLNMDLSSVIWKQLLEIPLAEADLQSFDYTASKSLKFIDPSNDLPFTEEEFNEYLGYLSWTTVLSDGTTQVELKPGGSHQRVSFEQRHEYASKAIQARLHESALLVQAIREGLLNVIPKQSLHFLTWRELELRVCGRPTVDLSVLEAHTVYSPVSYNRQTPIIQWFWKILSEFTEEELGKFLQFCWARSRLPADDQHGSYRMQLNILDATPKHHAFQQSDGAGPNDMLLPTSETCFFNVNMPKYSNLETMRAKMKMALLCSTITS